VAELEVAGREASQAQARAAAAVREVLDQDDEETESEAR
jgi:hypothetical protein